MTIHFYLLESAMKNTIINKLSIASFFLIMCYGITFVNAAAEDTISDIYSSGFDACFSEGYHISELTKSQIYTTAQCFTSLLKKEGTEAVSLGASKLTIMQYSDSWYKAAVEKGHKQAQSSLDANRVAFNALEQQTYFGVIVQEDQLLASEKVFNSLDTDGNGMLSLAEASNSKNLKDTFSEVDYDNDGVLSAGEYIILYGDMTAAGNK